MIELSLSVRNVRKKGFVPREILLTAGSVAQFAEFAPTISALIEPGMFLDEAF